MSGSEGMTEMDAARWDVLGLASGGRFVEVGVHEGDFSARILEACRPEKLYLVDPWMVFTDEIYEPSWYGTRVAQSEMDRRHRDVEARFSAEIARGEVEVMRAKSRDVVGTFADESLDFVYLDGDHSYEGTRFDTRAFAPKVKKGGFLVGDDYALDGWWKDGVVRAFHELLAEGDFIVEMKLDRQIALRRLR